MNSNFPLLALVAQVLLRMHHRQRRNAALGPTIGAEHNEVLRGSWQNGRQCVFSNWACNCLLTLRSLRIDVFPRRVREPSDILVTGASSGFGDLMVADLVQAGHRVAGTVRDPEERNKNTAQTLREMGVQVVDIDVTDDASVEAGFAKAEAALGHIDVSVSNAGLGAYGLQENFSGADFHRIFDVNVFGVQRMIRAVLPAMRARQSGLILNVTSLHSRVTVPFIGLYNAVKWAVEALSENDRWELSQFGVDVAVIEPVGLPTNFFANLIKPSSRDRDTSYGAFAGAPEAMLQSVGESLASNPL